VNWLSGLTPLVKLFSGPIGNVITTGIATASGAAITWAVAKGIDANLAATVVGSLGVIVAATINSLTGTQIVQIQNVRENQTNGVTVVPAREARDAGIRPVDGPVNAENPTGQYNPNAG
jgi:hypothetical protein